jgi:hypothetical protein
MRLRKFLRKIHRWIGVIASIWLFLLATTGFLLQHKDGWKLDEKYTNSTFLLSLYDIGDQFISYETNTSSIAQLDYHIYLNSKPIIKLEEALIGAILLQETWILATQSKLYWMDKEGNIVQSMDDLDGIPMPIDNLGSYNNTIIIQNSDQALSLETLEPLTKSPTWSLPTNSKKLKTELISTMSHNYLSYQQLIFDLHAGITSPSLFNDLAAFALIFLSISGIVIFFKKSFKRQR